MILVRVRQHQADKAFALFDEIADVGQDQIDAGQVLFRRERDAEIDREPLAVALDADAAERREHQLLRSRHRQAPPIPNTSPAVTLTMPPGWST